MRYTFREWQRSWERQWQNSGGWRRRRHQEERGHCPQQRHHSHSHGSVCCVSVAGNTIFGTSLILSTLFSTCWHFLVKTLAAAQKGFLSISCQTLFRITLLSTLLMSHFGDDIWSLLFFPRNGSSTKGVKKLWARQAAAVRSCWSSSLDWLD